MKPYKIDWSKKETETYVMLYASQNISVSKKTKRKLFVPELDKNDFKRICSEFSQDNDFQSLQKILHSIKIFDYSKTEILHLVDKLKSLCEACKHSSYADKIKLNALNKLLLN